MQSFCLTIINNIYISLDYLLKFPKTSGRNPKASRCNFAIFCAPDLNIKQNMMVYM